MSGRRADWSTHPPVRELVQGELALRIPDEVAASLVSEDMGRQSPHLPFDGRDALGMAYHRALDMVLFLKQAICEGDVTLAPMFEQTLVAACELRRKLLIRDGV